MGILNMTYNQIQRLLNSKRVKSFRLTPAKLLTLLGLFVLLNLLHYAIKNNLHYMVWEILKALFEKEQQEIIRYYPERGEVDDLRKKIWGL